MATLFPPPKNIDWTKLKAFGYPWHGKWEQVEVNGQWKDRLTLVHEHDGAETPAPVDEQGNNLIPKLASGAHLIDQKMPWAKPDSETVTPESIRQYGGKFWNQVLFAPGNPAYLYGKPIGAADALYAAPDGSIWAYRLQLISTSIWVPGKGDAGDLLLSMRRVAGDLKNPQKNNAPTIYVPLTGASTLLTLFPDIVEQIPDVYEFSPIRGALVTGGTSSYPDRRAYMRFVDAVPDGSRGLYSISCSLVSGISIAPIIALFELTLSGTPGTGNFSAVLSAHSGPQALLEYTENLSDEYVSFAHGGEFKVEGFSSGDTSITVTFEPDDPAPLHLYRYLTAKAAYIAGYVNGVVVIKSLACNYVNDEIWTASSSASSFSLSVPSPAEDEGAEVSCEEPFTVNVSCVSTWEASVSFGGELIQKQEGALSYSDSLVGSCFARLSAFNSSWFGMSSGYSLSAQPPGTGNIYGSATNNYSGKILSDSEQVPTIVGSIVTAAYAGGFQLQTGQQRTSSASKSFSPRLDFRFTPMPQFATSNYAVDISVVSNIPTAGNYPLVVRVSPLPETPQVVHLSTVIRDQTAQSFYVTGLVRTMGNAGHEVDMTTTHNPTRYVTWCPVRDQLLFTLRPSSWV